MSDDIKFLIELIQNGENPIHYELVKYLLRASPFFVLKTFGVLLASIGLTAKLVNDWFYIEKRENDRQN